MTALLWYLAGGMTLAPFLAVGIHLFLMPSVRARGIAEGRRQVLQRNAFPSVPAPRRRSPDHQLVTRAFSPSRSAVADDSR
jgi:hypothetical protein